MIRIFKFPLSFTNVNVIVDGNSISTSDFGTSYLTQLVSSYINSYAPTTTNRAVSGQRTINMTADAITDIDPLLKAGKRNILIGWEVTNDVGYVGATVAFDNIQLYCNARRKAGYEVITMTCLPRVDRDDATLLLPVNQLMMDNWGTFCDGIIDVRLDARLTNYNNTFYYAPDKIHTNTEGNKVIAELVHKKMKTMYGI